MSNSIIQCETIMLFQNIWFLFNFKRKHTENHQVDKCLPLNIYTLLYYSFSLKKLGDKRKLEYLIFFFQRFQTSITIYFVSNNIIIKLHPSSNTKHDELIKFII